VEGKSMSIQMVEQTRPQRSHPQRSQRTGKQFRRSLPAALLACSIGQILMSGSAWAAPVALPGTARGEIRREIADPCLGFHWRLIVDPAGQGRPGRLVLLDQNGTTAGGSASSAHTVLAPAASAPESALVIIRAGEHVVVDQDTGVVRARLNAIALESAAFGQRLRVRLIVGPGLPRNGLSRNAELTAPGPVVSALATGVGEARWLISGQAAQPANELVKEWTSR
jgi:hypothetical protein